VLFRSSESLTMSEEGHHSAIEVTDADHLRTTVSHGNRARIMTHPGSHQSHNNRERTMSNQSNPSTQSATNKHFRLFHKHNMINPKESKNSNYASASVSSDLAIQSLTGSVANMTVASNDTANTVKVSNRQKTLMQAKIKNTNTKWKKLKRFMGVKKEESELVLMNLSLTKNNARSKNLQLDAAILGRLDGMDVLSLGPANLSSHATRTTFRNVLLDSFHPKLTPERMVQDVLWTSSGKVPAEMVLEGYLPRERWTVVMDSVLLPRSRVVDGHTSPIPSVASTDDDCGSSVITCDDGSLPIHLLLDSMWGSSCNKAQMQSRRTASDNGTEDDFMELAAACSVPIDIDEDTFIIETPHHLQSVHDIASVPLRKGDYERALEVMFKILHGLEGDGNKLILLGSCWHNIGIIQMWQCKYSDALESLEKAVRFRTENLPLNHPDVAVSFLRYSLAAFALGRLSDAIGALERALIMHPKESMTRAKILNNLGVVYYQLQDLVNALKHFTSALEIQRQWLDGPVRRESIVYDATITLGNMGKCYLEKHDYGTAFYVYEEAFLVRVTCAGICFSCA